jgi:hypothetical protein
MIKIARSIASTPRFRARGPLCAIAIAALCALFPALIAASGDPFRYRGGVRNSPGPRKLNSKQLDAALKSLREKAGFLEMRFDEDGFLTLGDRTKFTGGSPTARALLIAAIEMPHAVDLECHNYSALVAFARLAMAVAYHNFPSGKIIDVYPVEIDFGDLSQLRGDRQALEAFDLGFVILHELGHAALGLRDSSGDADGLGECEEFINRIRRELGLPERQTYVAQVYSAPANNPTRASIKQAELVFARATEKQGRLKLEKFNLIWEAPKVGPIVDIRTQSVARARGAKPMTAAAP